MRSKSTRIWTMVVALALYIHTVCCANPAACFSSTCTQDELNEALCDDSVCGVSQLQLISAMSRFDEGFDLGYESNDTSPEGTTWDIFDANGVKYTDVAQGELGTCYFLAALVSIAKTQPKIIENMFVDRELWKGKTPVYTTKWMINGQSRLVAVNGKVPVNPKTGMPVFTRFNDGMDFWPVVLEKAWAKIFGVYKRISGGLMQEAFRAVTEAPVETIMHDRRDGVTPDVLWDKLQEAKKNKFPIGAGSKRNNVGIPSGHAFAVFDSKVMPGHGPAVHVYNPWAKDHYQGKIPNPDKKDGQFFMTINEYFESFDHTTVARTSEGYVVSSTTLSKQTDATVTAMEFSVKSNKPFDIEFEWPSERFVHGCHVLSPQFTLAVAKKGSKPGSYDNLIVAKKSAPQMNNAGAEVKSGSGTYVAFLRAEFPHGPWLKQMVLNTFAPEQITFAPVKSNSAMDVFIQMTGMCGNSLSVKGFGVFEKNDNQLAYGVPTFVRQKAPRLILFWNPYRHEDLGKGRYMIKGDNTWKMTDSLEHAKSGRYYKIFDPPKMVSCSSDDFVLLQDATETVQKLFQTEPEDGPELIQEQFVMRPEDDVKYDTSSLLVTHEDKAADCAHLLARLEHLNNVKEIQQGRDGLFPNQVSSIGGANEHCGDSAAGNGQSCANYNTWHDFGEIAAKLGQAAVEKDEQIKMMEKCIDSHPEGGKCLVKNHCKQKVKMVCDTMDGTGGKKHVTHHVMNIPGGAKGKASSYYCSCKHFTLLSLSGISSRLVEGHLSLLDE